MGDVKSHYTSKRLTLNNYFRLGGGGSVLRFQIATHNYPINSNTCKIACRNLCSKTCSNPKSQTPPQWSGVEPGGRNTLHSVIQVTYVQKHYSKSL
jgi:hypothetical protein